MWNYFMVSLCILCDICERCDDNDGNDDDDDGTVQCSVLIKKYESNTMELILDGYQISKPIDDSH